MARSRRRYPRAGVAPAYAQASGTLISVTTTDDELNQDGDCALRDAIQAANTDQAVDAAGKVGGEGMRSRC